MTEDRDVEVTHEAPSFVAELRRLADAIETGEAFTIEVDGEHVTIPEGARMSIAHEREDGEVELEFQVTWSLPETDADEDEEEDEDDRDATVGDDVEAETPATDTAPATGSEPGRALA